MFGRYLQETTGKDGRPTSTVTVGPSTLYEHSTFLRHRDLLVDLLSVESVTLRTILTNDSFFIWMTKYTETSISKYNNGVKFHDIIFLKSFVRVPSLFSLFVNVSITNSRKQIVSDIDNHRSNIITHFESLIFHKEYCVNKLFWRVDFWTG